MVSSGQVKAEEVMVAFIKQSEKLNPKLNAFITMNDQAIQQAKEVDAKIAKKQNPGRLAGVPVAVKDMLCTKNLKTTAGSKILENFVPTYSATVVNRLEAEGAITIGKANQDEFAMGSSNETSAYGDCKNPWSLEHVPGGSSGGSAAAVAAKMSPLAIGTDTGGSIRQPASFCGVVGVKPTYGRVSRYGIVAYASSLDQAGPLTPTVRDSALSLEVMSGKDHLDMTSSNQAVPEWSKNLNPNLKGMKIGLPKEYFTDKLSPNSAAAIDRAKEIVKDSGAEFVEVSIPYTKLGVPMYYIIATCEASSNLARYDGVRYGFRADFSKDRPDDIDDFYSRTRGEGFGPEVKRRIMLGTYALSSGYYDAYYKKACQVRRMLRQNFIDAFQKCDVLLSPVYTTPAFKLGSRIQNPVDMYFNDVFTTSTNLAGLPGMSLPAGFSKEGLPIGIQLTAGHFEEQKMLNVGYAIEQSLKLNEVPSVIR
ncbi:MAG: Asp-tRNA(Asn)/Glu-tRNA(Gln) amidotransferase subunit GatA [Bdellovibrionales bacterium]|nr:Asp-tRNA(Asn)/Glu-tRNA(Gln) amidotransferase subunit GatA [Bdellovibrionales bacterium]